MPLKLKGRSKDKVILSIRQLQFNIENNLIIFTNLTDDFSMEWLLGVEANYKEFLNYVFCSIKKYEENKKSK